MREGGHSVGLHMSADPLQCCCVEDGCRVES